MYPNKKHFTAPTFSSRILVALLVILEVAGKLKGSLVGRLKLISFIKDKLPIVFPTLPHLIMLAFG
jgi:hypothetical protein